MDPSYDKSGQMPQPRGDIILSGDEPKRSNKGLLFIAAAVVGILLIVGILVMVLTGRGGSGNSASNNEDYNNFLKYANFLLDGTENSKDDIGNFDKAKEYALVKAYVDDNSGFFTKAQELWKVFYDAAKADEKYSDTSKLMGDVEYQNELMDFIAKYMATKDLESDDLLKLYVENGADNAKAQIDKNYEALLGVVFEPGKDYATTSADYAKRVVDLYAIYDSHGCIQNGEVSEVCLESNSKEIASAAEGYLSELQEIDYNVASDAIDDLLDFCFRIKDDFGEKNG